VIAHPRVTWVVSEGMGPEAPAALWGNQRLVEWFEKNL
jgi:hypothetical protein